MFRAICFLLVAWYSLAASPLVERSLDWGALLELPEEMRALPAEFVSLPMRGDVRPNTADTLIAWIQSAKPGTFLFVSNQPYCGYQHGVINRLLSEEFLFEVAGEGTRSESAGRILDSIALWNLQNSEKNLYTK